MGALANMSIGGAALAAFRFRWFGIPRSCESGNPGTARAASLTLQGPDRRQRNAAGLILQAPASPGVAAMMPMDGGGGYGVADRPAQGAGGAGVIAGGDVGGGDVGGGDVEVVAAAIEWWAGFIGNASFCWFRRLAGWGVRARGYRSLSAPRPGDLRKVLLRWFVNCALRAQPRSAVAVAVGRLDRSRVSIGRGVSTTPVCDFVLTGR